MLRLVERMFGEGDLHQDGSPGEPQPVGYEFDVYRDWHAEGDQWRPGEWVIEGHLLARPEVLAGWAGCGQPFTLRMDDGRHLSVFILDGNGRVVNVEGTTFSPPASGRTA